MTGKRKELPRRLRVATKYQVWRLNVLGRLALVDEAEPITAEQAWEAIAAELEALGLERFPGVGEPSPEPSDSRRVLDQPLDGGGVEEPESHVRSSGRVSLSD